MSHTFTFMNTLRCATRIPMCRTCITSIGTAIRRIIVTNSGASTFSNTIGPAGERLNRFACWMNEDDRSSGRGGTGCVGGSKLLNG